MSEKYAHTGGHGRSLKTYHTDRDCRVAPDLQNQRPIDVDEIKRRGISKCSVCAGEDATASGRSDRDYDELVKKLREEMNVQVQP